jgi:hypothetical protein
MYFYLYFRGIDRGLNKRLVCRGVRPVDGPEKGRPLCFILLVHHGFFVLPR